MNTIRQRPTQFGFNFGGSSEASIREGLRIAAQPLKISERRSEPDSATFFTGNLIIGLIETVEHVSLGGC